MPKLKKPQKWLTNFNNKTPADFRYVVTAPGPSAPSKSLADLELEYQNLESLYELQRAVASDTKARANAALDAWTKTRLAICDPARHPLRAAK